MKIEIYSDIHCPFCYLGKRRLELDLAKLPNGDKVEILYRGYVLDPKAEKVQNRSVYEAQAVRKGMEASVIEANYQNIAEQGKEYGMNCNMDAVVPTNTIDALALVQFAQTKGLQSLVMEKLYEAYYVNGKNISDWDQLVQIGLEAGLSASEIREALGSGLYQEIVLNDDKFARAKKIEGIPYFVVNGQHEFFGSTEMAKVVECLQKGMRPKLQEIKPPSDMACKDGACG